MRRGVCLLAAALLAVFLAGCGGQAGMDVNLPEHAVPAAAPSTPSPTPMLEPAPTPAPEPTPVPKTVYPESGSHRVTVLMYHHLVADGEPINGMTITAGRFAEDMRWLKDNGYATVLPRELAAGEPLPDRAVMVTFDDGYASNYLLAFPVLQELDMKAAIAVVGTAVDAYDFSFLDWDMCREMSDSGLVEIGSHTYNLHNMDEARKGNYVKGGPNGIERLPGETQAEYEARVLPDLQRSIDAITEHLDAPVTYLAYPFGVKDAWASGYIADHFAMTLLTNSGVADLSGGLYSLPRKTVTMDHRASDCF